MLYLVRYGEIGLKSAQVRRRLRDRLLTNIQDVFVNEGAECITSAEEGRVFVRSDDDEVASRILSRTFGVVSFSPVVECSSAPEDIKRNVISIFRGALASGATFAIRARRSGTHSYTSQQLASDIGSAVQAAFDGIEVNLGEPEVEIFVEVRGNNGYLYDKVVSGPGGLPLGSQGKVLGFVENVEDAVSCWLMMKRGCKVHFASKKTNKYVQVLEGWDPNPRSHRFEDENSLDELVRKLRIEGLVFGSDVDELRYEKYEGLAIFYPVVGFSREEISVLASHIGLESDPHEETQ